MASKWATPTVAIHRGEDCPFKLLCSFDTSPAPESDMLCVGEEFGVELPAEVVQFWRKHQAASLFKDVAYGQWGLEILSPADAIIESRSFLEERRNDVLDGDLVIGKFVGDSDILLLRTDPNSVDYASVLVALPLDCRGEWPLVANDFAEFLDKYEREQGDKHWEIVRES